MTSTVIGITMPRTSFFPRTSFLSVLHPMNYEKQSFEMTYLVLAKYNGTIINVCGVDHTFHLYQLSRSSKDKRSHPPLSDFNIGPPILLRPPTPLSDYQH